MMYGLCNCADTGVCVMPNVNSSIASMLFQTDIRYLAVAQTHKTIINDSCIYI